jgi:cyanophycinase
MPEQNHPSKAGRGGHLVVIGGGEDRKRDKKILSRFIELAGGTDAKIAVLTAASKVPEDMWNIYDEAFGDLGVRTRIPIHARSRADANDPHLAEEVISADGIFMTGGDQKRLLAMIGGTALDEAMHRAFKERNACIGGTSAGASAMSGHMLAEGKAELRPGKGPVNLAAGLGFLQRVVIDQHFSERQRLARLLTAVAHNPYLLGVGIDEDTALVIERGAGIEVLGEGAVTVIDGRHMISNFLDAGERDSIELINVKLHMLPAGSRYVLASGDDPDKEPGRKKDNGIPAPLQEFVNIITKRNPMS